MSKWGWYRIQADIAEDGVLGANLKEVGECYVGDVMEHLAYLKDMAGIERLRDNAASGKIVH